MHPKIPLCGGRFSYGNGYITMAVPVEGLPETLQIGGHTLIRKTSFHVSLVCVKALTGGDGEKERMALQAFETYAGIHEIKVAGYTGEYRLAEKGVKKTLIAMCDIIGLDAFRQSLAETLRVEIPDQPYHVTLFCLQPDDGIGLNTAADINNFSKVVEIPQQHFRWFWKV